LLEDIESTILPRPDKIVSSDLDNVLKHCEREMFDLKGASVLITGGTGFVGRFIVESLAKYNERNPGLGSRLYLPTRNLRALQKSMPHLLLDPNIFWFEWDGVERLSSIVEKCDYVLHGAAEANPSSWQSNAAESMRSGVHLAEAIIDFSAERDVKKILYLSSGAAYGLQDESPLVEHIIGAEPLDKASSSYGETKRFCELLFNMSGLPVVTAKLFSFIGPYLNLGASFAICEFIRDAERDGVIGLKTNGDSLRTYCYSSDLTIYLLKLLLLGDPGSAYNVGSAGPLVSIRDLAECVAGHFKGVAVEMVGSGDVGLVARSCYQPDMTRSGKFHLPQVGFSHGVYRTLQSLYLQGVLRSVPVSDGKEK
jgi:nucleoside-diphosphate-sugar epimerase